MRYLLAPRGREELLDLARQDPLLAFDFDGTLTPLIPEREQAFMRPMTFVRLLSVATMYKCAIITGRSRSDMIARVAGIRLAAVVGNHGMEPCDDESAFERTAQSWVSRLEPLLRAIDGAELENKRLSLSVHYWRAASPRRALRDILSATRQLGEEVQVIRGHTIVNLIPRGAAMKSGAVRRVMNQLQTDRALFIGDDLTDEEAFQSLDHLKVMTIRVGRTSRSHAAYYLQSQSEIDDLLDLIRSVNPPVSSPR